MTSVSSGKSSRHCDKIRRRRGCDKIESRASQTGYYWFEMEGYHSQRTLARNESCPSRIFPDGSVTSTCRLLWATIMGTDGGAEAAAAEWQIIGSRGRRRRGNMAHIDEQGLKGESSRLTVLGIAHKWLFAKSDAKNKRLWEVAFSYPSLFTTKLLKLISWIISWRKNGWYSYERSDPVLPLIPSLRDLKVRVKVEVPKQTIFSCQVDWHAGSKMSHISKA